MTDPDLTTEVVGYRQWYVTPDLELRAAGFTSGGAWTQGDNTAKCGRTRDSDDYAMPPQPDPCGDCPGEACNCGFYGLHNPSDHWYGNTNRHSNLWTFALGPTTTDPLISGIILAWGKLQVHHQGFRAEHARVAALALPESKRDQIIARVVANAYGVPCVPPVQLPKIAAEFGSTVPVEFRPDKPKPKREDLWLSGSGYARSGALYFPPVTGTTMTFSNVTWSSALLTPPPAPTPPPKVSPEARKRMEMIEGIKKGANRQGPPKPKRPPRTL